MLLAAAPQTQDDRPSLAPPITTLSVASGGVLVGLGFLVASFLTFDNPQLKAQGQLNAGIIAGVSLTAVVGATVWLVWTIARRNHPSESAATYGPQSGVE